MVLWATLSLPSGRLFPFSVVATAAVPPPKFFFSELRENFCFHHVVRPSKVRVCAAGRIQGSSLQRRMGAWEDPDDGSGSEYDDEYEEMEEYDLDFESDWEEEKDASATVTGVSKSAARKYEDDLVKGSLPF